MKHGILALAAVLFIGLATAADARQSRSFTVELNALNDSGVEGSATLVANYDAGTITVMITASGLEADQPHAQHIHGFTANRRKSKCPTMVDDIDGDNLLSLDEGMPIYGPDLLPLEPFPIAPEGAIDFVETYPLDEALKPLQNRAIVIHGATIAGVYDPTLPVACGMLKVQPPGRAKASDEG